MTEIITPKEDLDLDSVSKRLKYVIEQSGVKQSHIAKKLGVTRGAVHYILNNEAKNPRSAKKIADLLGVDSEWLYSGKPQKSKQPQEIIHKFNKAVSAAVPLYYIDQIFMQQQNPVGHTDPIGEVFTQRTYDNPLFAVQLTTPSPLQKFEIGETIIFMSEKKVKPGDWVLVYRPEEERILLGMIILQESGRTSLLHHKLDQPILLKPDVDDIIGVFVESVKYAKL